jgi:hypothetical protein
LKQVVSATLSTVPTNRVGTALGLALRADEARVGWRFPSIRYAVRRITVHFELADCEFPEEYWAHDVISLNEIQSDYETLQTIESSTSGAIDWSAASASTTPSASAKISGGALKKTNRTGC